MSVVRAPREKKFLSSTGISHGQASIVKEDQSIRITFKVSQLILGVYTFFMDLSGTNILQN